MGVIHDGATYLTVVCSRGPQESSQLFMAAIPTWRRLLSWLFLDKIAPQHVLCAIKDRLS